MGVFGDVKTQLGPLFWDKEWEAKLPAALEKAQAKLELLSNFYGEKDFALGYVTLIDFQIA